MRALIRQALTPLRSLRLVAMHFVLNAALAAAASYWLLIPETHVWQLAFTAISGLLIVCLFLWLHSGTFIYAAHQDFRVAFSIKLMRWIFLALGMAVLLWLVHRIEVITSSQSQIGGYLYSKAPSLLRPTHGSTGYVRALGCLLSIVNWYLLPGLILPVTAARVVGSELRTALRAIFSWRYWLALAATTLLGVWITKILLQWMPGATLQQQTAGLVVRLGLAYILATVAWLLTIGLLGYFVASDDGTPVEVVGEAAA
jgi:hypothetical protein